MAFDHPLLQDNLDTRVCSLPGSQLVGLAELEEDIHYCNHELGSHADQPSVTKKEDVC